MSLYKQFRAARKYGYRSCLELKVSTYLKDLKIKFLYEAIKIEWEDLAYRTYTPDFVLHNGIIIETKGRFTAADRRKHLAIKKQHPDRKSSIYPYEILKKHNVCKYNESDKTLNYLKDLNLILPNWQHP